MKILMKKSKIIVVMPAYNAEKTLAKTVKKIPRDIVDKIVLVDDASSDRTVSVAKKLRLNLFIHSKNLGYGGNQKTCYEEALKLGADIVVMLHPDYQYDPKHIREVTNKIVGGYDVVLGCRVVNRSDTLKNGMPLYKYLGNRLLTFLENVVLGLNLGEYHTGYRAYTDRVLKKINLKSLSNDFVFDQQILIATHLSGFYIGEVATPCYYRKESSSINLKRSIIYGLSIIFYLFCYLTNKDRLRKKWLF